MLELVGISNVPTVPSQKEVAFVIGSKGKVQSIAHAPLRHQSVRQININNVRHFIGNLQTGNLFQESNGLIPRLVITFRKFGKHSLAGL